MPRRPSLTPEPDSIAGRLSHLCRTKHPANRGPLTAQEVAEMVTELGGVQVTGSYIAQVRGGRRTNPTVDVLRALAKVFDVPLTYFFEDCEGAACSVHHEDSQSIEVVEAMAKLSKPSREALASMARHLRQVESV